MQVDPDRVIAAGKKMIERAEKIAAANSDLNADPNEANIFGGGMEGWHQEFPTSYYLKGMASMEHAWDPTGDWAWFSEVYCEEQTFQTDSQDAPWAQSLHEKWYENLENRSKEARNVAEEIDYLRERMVSFLDESSEVDVENSGLVSDPVDGMGEGKPESDDDAYAQKR